MITSFIVPYTSALYSAIHVSARSRRAQGVPSFAEAAARVLEQKRADWRSGSHAQAWMSSLERYAFPRIVKYTLAVRNTLLWIILWIQQRISKPIVTLAGV